MIKCSSGFSFAETLAAFSIWTIIVGLLIPQFTILTIERMHAKQTVEAYKILYEKTQDVMLNKTVYQDEQFVIDNRQYQLIWREEGKDKNACLYWKGITDQDESVCLPFTK
ncbi:competence type IV pilus minor pilin ComGE [Metabacillus malikii]|uniref:Type II secretion system protein n=1 Tax=Metabacillus malikii TaxID=1504265 RepID=A0ABT9ZJ86_9BACI|nr:competence type IV pilus minor pilin ComGE [Metabacillus malikii]MDQ0231964.1 hypothetical protein [Metabacillus malikii]